MNIYSLIPRLLVNGLRTFNKDATVCRRYRSDYPASTSTLQLSKCLLVSKVTRFEFERSRLRSLSDTEFEATLRKRGTDYDALLSYHNQQKSFELDVVRNLTDLGVNVRVVNRMSYNTELIDWCDIVMPCGGDGTFLLAASKVRDNSKPVIGFNSAPERSIGRLCLPGWCTKDIRGAIQSLKEGRFRWSHRTRIRTTVTTDMETHRIMEPVSLHTTQLSRYAVSCQGYESENVSQPEYMESDVTQSVKSECITRVIPILALNEVFIGESVSARVSHLQLTVDDGTASPTTKTKSSGLCVTTGTGSTSWHLSINCLRTQSVQELLRLFASEFELNVDTSTEKARLLTERYNNTLIFPPDSPKLAYSVRELIQTEGWPTPTGLRARDFATNIRVKSHCVDAGLVIDGGVSFPFNDGTEAYLQVLPEDTLRTIVMNED